MLNVLNKKVFLIFVHVKTTYCSHRHNNFWDTKPVILNDVRLTEKP